MALFSKHIPENSRVTLEIKTLGEKLLNPLGHLRIFTPAERNSREISLYIRHEDWNTYFAELLGQNSKCHGLTCTRCSSNEAMSIGHLGQYGNVALSFGNEESWRCLGHFGSPL